MRPSPTVAVLSPTVCRSYQRDLLHFYREKGTGERRGSEVPPLIATLEVNSHRRLLDIMHLEYVNPPYPCCCTHPPPLRRSSRPGPAPTGSAGRTSRPGGPCPTSPAARAGLHHEQYLQSVPVCLHGVYITTVFRTAKAVERFLCNLGRPTDQRNQPVPKKRPGNALGLPSALGPAFKDKDKAGKMKIGMKMR